MTKNDSHPAQLRFAVLASDVALFSVRNNELLVRLIAVNRPPYFVNTPGLPGGLLDPTKTAEEAAARHLHERAGIDISKVYMEQLATFSAPERDPRGRVVAVAYLAVVPWESLTESEREYSEISWWCPVSKVPTLAYDHNEVLQVAIQRLRSRVTYTTITARLMPREFTLTELEQTYECIIHEDLDKRNFRKKILKLKILKPLGKKRTGGRSRPAELYRFTSSEMREIEVL